MNVDGNKMRLNVWLLLPPVAIFIYVFIRAKILALTWDEAYSFFEFVRHPSWLPHDFNYMAANNHLLNTWLMKLSVGIFGQSEIALRLPNALSSALYLFAATKICQFFSPSKGQQLAAFFVLAVNPYLLDFFCLARGYGMSLAFLMAAFWQVLRFTETPKLKFVFTAQLLLVLAVLANLTLLYGFVALTGVFLFLHWRENRLARMKETAAICLIPLLFAAGIFSYLLKLEQCKAFFFGEEAKSAYATFYSLAENSLYGETPFASMLTVLLLALPAIAATVFFLRRKNIPGPGRHLFPLLFFVFAALLMIVLHLATGTNYLIGRTALLFLPVLSLLVLSLCFLLPEKWGKILLPAAGLAAGINFCFAANVHFTYEYREQADVKDMMLKLKSGNVAVADPFFANVLVSDLPFEQQINYYLMRFGMTNFGHVPRRVEVPCKAWYYLPLSEVSKYDHAKIIESFGRQTALFTTENRPQLKNVGEVWQDFEHEYPMPELITDTAFFGDKGTLAAHGKFSANVSILHLDTMRTMPEAVTVSCRLRTLTRNTSALLVVNFDTAGGSCAYFMHLSEIPVKPGQWSVTAMTYPVPSNACKVSVYLWNKDEKPVYMDNVAIRLLAP